MKTSPFINRLTRLPLVIGTAAIIMKNLKRYCRTFWLRR